MIKMRLSKRLKAITEFVDKEDRIIDIGCDHALLDIYIKENIKNRKIVLVNTTAMETKIAQRLVDFISGACCVLGAQLQEVEQRVYLLSPSNVEVSNELRSEISSKALFNWNK